MDCFFEYLDAWVNKINKVFVFIGALLLIGLMVTVNVDLFMRFFFHAPIMGMNEVTELFLLYITFLGTAWVYRDDGHVVVDVLLYNLVEGRKKRRADTPEPYHRRPHQSGPRLLRHESPPSITR